MIKTACPKPETLGEYVAGAMDSARMLDLEQHLLECQACCEQAEGLNARDEVTAAFGLPGPIAGADESVVEDLIGRVSKLRAATTETVSVPAAGQATGFDGEAPSDTDPKDLLSPPLGPDELGRLGDYRVLKVLGSGGMGFVFLAEDDRLRRRVALKVMRPTEARKKGAKDRFLREARAAAALDHDNVVTIHQVGEDRGVPFIAMPMLQGGSLKSVLERQTRLPQAKAVSICRQVAEGLSAAHQTGLIHRDIKPDNLWIDSTKNRVKILDFGLVRELDSEDGLTLHGTVLGTPSYMSPEQAAGEKVDHRSDLFSLGAVLYQMLSGRSPYAGANLTATLMNVARAQPTPIETLVQGLDSELVTLVTTLNSRDPSDRPQSADEVVQTLERIESRLAIPVSTSVSALPRINAQAAESRKPPKSPWFKYAAAAGGAAALVLAITFFVQIGKHTVQITLDDPSIALKIDGEDILIEDQKAVTRLSAGTHRLTVEREGLSTATDEFTVEKDGKNVVHVAIVNGRFEIGKAGDQPTLELKSPEVANASPPQMADATTDVSIDASDDPDRRAAQWMRSLNPPLSFRLVSTRDRNTQWEFLPESTGPITTEPFHVHGMFLTAAYTDKLKDATAEDVAAHINGIRHLETLRVSSDLMTTLGVGKLLEIPEFRGIAQVDVSGATMNDQMFAFLAKLPALEKANFANVPQMKGTGISSLAACPRLNAIGWTIATPTVESMEELSKLPHLAYLEINSIKCTESHVLAIAKLNLRNLYLYNSGLDDAMVKHLANLTELELLNISNGQITDAGLSELKGLKRLTYLDIRRTLITAEGIAEFKKALPECQVNTDLPQPDA